MIITEKLTRKQKPRRVYYRVMVTRHAPDGAQSRSVSLRPDDSQDAEQSAADLLNRLIDGLKARVADGTAGD